MSLATDWSHMVVLFFNLYDLCVNLKRYVITLLYRYDLDIVIIPFCARDNHECGAMMMEITLVRWRCRSKTQGTCNTISHIKLYMMFILLRILFCLVKAVVLI
jgi:hypothetical protein